MAQEVSKELQWWIEWDRKEKRQKLERFRRLNRYARKGQIVFAGSSLMEQFPIYEFLQDFELPFTIYNRGVGGFVTSELLAAMNECILALEPAHLFINIGTNDLSMADYEEAAMIGRYESILTQVEQTLPNCKLHLLAYYPVNPTLADTDFAREGFRHRTNQRIQEASDAVRRLADKHGAEFLDLNRGLYDADGNLKAEYTVEGIHMYADGYKQVLDVLLPILKAL